MINEVLYCERLMYLEWVQGEWDDNAFTVDGQGVHRRVNEEGKPLREANDEDDEIEPQPHAARSVWLSSERLGITAKIDLVEVEDATVVPIEYKRGAKAGSTRRRLSAGTCAGLRSGAPAARTRLQVRPSSIVIDTRLRSFA